MNLEEKENYNLEDQNFQNNERYLDPDIDTPPDHTISDNAEPDYGNDLESQEFGKENFDNENLGNEQTDSDEFSKDDSETDELDDEFDNEDLGEEELDNEDLGNLDDEEGIIPDRNL
ncbi:hypothetical protein [Flavobacterium quisquiliarum]|uniref:Uncharacterized protein n=1 Tax=Flavobacterium quisquiliarum TaxID=1834436 RepID=A0ABV8W1J9_9FLAO|nr:hypothetical protein [Flavobacterium quisquiliarum]MBW1656110.1 hypothetical protein [Flavobacterium quisquiliarum]